MSTELTRDQHDAVTQAVRSVLDEKFDVRDAYPLMDDAARAAGWDDPAEDIYE